MTRTPSGPDKLAARIGIARSEKPTDTASAAAAASPQTVATPTRSATTGPDEDCGDFGLRIGRDGTWYYRDSPINRKPLVKLFATVLRREPSGYFLVTPVERGRIEVEDAPFTAVSVSSEGTGRARRLTFTTNLDQEVTADADHPIRVAVDAESGEPRPYVEVRDQLEALILRSVYYELVEWGETVAENGTDRYGIWSSGIFFPLG